MRSLLYVSRRNGSSAGGSAYIEDIVRTSRLRNAALDVTGALVAAPRHFAQMLEGPPAAVDQLMAAIAADPRHEIAEVIDLVPGRNREFAAWSLAYCGESSYIAAMLSEAVAAPDAQIEAHAEHILVLMRMFT